jgi:hypothetical protein
VHAVCQVGKADYATPTNPERKSCIGRAMLSDSCSGLRNVSVDSQIGHIQNNLSETDKIQFRHDRLQPKSMKTESPETRLKTTSNSSISIRVTVPSDDNVNNDDSIQFNSILYY